MVGAFLNAAGTCPRTNQTLERISNVGSSRDRTISIVAFLSGPWALSFFIDDLAAWISAGVI